MSDDRLREILPLLRPRSAEPTLFSQTVFYLLWIGLAVLLALYVLRWHRLRQRRRQEFFEAGTEAGLRDKQIELLLRIAHQRRMKRPDRLLRSPHDFDRQVGPYASKLARSNLEHPELQRIASIRSALGFDELDVDQALSSTRQIDRGLTIMVWQEADDHGVEGYAPWLVLERDEGSLTLAPLLRDGDDAHDGHLLEAGDDLVSRFWREGDTEYRFESTVVERAATSVLVHHAPVERMQQRDFYRIPVEMPADMRILRAAAGDVDHTDAVDDAAIGLLDRAGGQGAPREGEPVADDPVHGLRVEATVPEPEEPEDPLAAAPRVGCRIVNLSAGGLAIVVARDTPGVTGDNRWIVDPAFEGDFPLAGLACRVVGDEVHPGGRLLKLRFESLPLAVEKEIVRGVYEHQLHAASGRAPRPRGGASASDGHVGEAEDALDQPAEAEEEDDR